MPQALAAPRSLLTLDLPQEQTLRVQLAELEAAHRRVDATFAMLAECVAALKEREARHRVQLQVLQAVCADTTGATAAAAGVLAGCLDPRASPGTSPGVDSDPSDVFSDGGATSDEEFWEEPAKPALPVQAPAPAPTPVPLPFPLLLLLLTLILF